MPLRHNDAPTPDLRIILTQQLCPHEEHDSQRALPLIQRLQQESAVINPPIVAPMGDDKFVILDGANRYYAFSQLQYPHILAQVVTYESEWVDLRTWRHIVCNWDADQFIHQLQQLPAIQLTEGTMDKRAIAYVRLKNQHVHSILVSSDDVHERNAALCEVVGVYQQQATLHRTALSEPEDIWPLYPDAIALLIFPNYEPSDIMTAARVQAFLPPGISRHIIHGRALRVNYSLELLHDKKLDLDEKNIALQHWFQAKLANRQVRYYAEASYQFDE
jgi:hypothetical protein